MFSRLIVSLLVLLVAVSWSVWRAEATELTFELPDRDKQCFYEQIDKGTRCTLEYQVVSGGNYDVDVVIYGPGDAILHQAQRKQYDSIDFNTKEKGEFYFCFSNEFSSFTHKLIYFDFVAGDEPPLTDEMGAHHTALTQLEMSTVRMHEALKIVRDYQTHHRLREAQGRDTAEYLNERTQYWSLGEAILLVSVGLAQVFILRRFFTDKRSNI